MPAILYICIIFVLSSMSHPPVHPKINDKVMHLVEFSLFVLLLYRAFNNGLTNRLNKRDIYLSVLIALAYGAMDEIHQMFVSNRVASVYDYIADCVGILIGWGLIVICSYLLGGRRFEFV